MSQPSNNSASKSGSSRASTYAVGQIPEFKPPVNYAAAASKSKPSPPAINGGDVPAAVIGSQSPSTPAAEAIAAVAGTGNGNGQQHSQGGSSAAQNKRPDAVNVPASRVNTLRSGAADCEFNRAVCLRISSMSM